MTAASQFGLRQVTVLAMISDRGTAQVRTYGGTAPDTSTFEVPVLPMRVRLPAPGEVWLLDRVYGFWTFAALMKSPTLYLSGRDTGWLQVPAAWLPKPSNAASLVASIRRIEHRVTLRLALGALTAATATGTGSVSPAGWQPTQVSTSLPVPSPSTTGSVLTLNAPTTGYWKIFAAPASAPAAATELTWLTEDAWPNTAAMTPA